MSASAPSGYFRIHRSSVPPHLLAAETPPQPDACERECLAGITIVDRSGECDFLLRPSLSAGCCSAPPFHGVDLGRCQEERHPSHSYFLSNISQCIAVGPMMKRPSSLESSPRAVVKRVVVQTLVRAFFGLPRPPIAVGPMLQCSFFPPC